MKPDTQHEYLLEIKNFLLDNGIKFKDHYHRLELNFNLFDQTVRLLIDVTIYDKLELTCNYFTTNICSALKDFKFNKYIVKDGKSQLRFSPELDEQNLTVDFICNMIAETKNTVKQINTLAYGSVLPFHYINNSHNG